MKVSLGRGRLASGVAAFGNFDFEGSTGGQHLNAPIVGTGPFIT